jgi:formamidopyrimidine-DNA glycosylase
MLKLLITSSVRWRGRRLNRHVQTMNKAVRLGGRDTEYDLYDSPGSYRVILDKRMKGKPCPECGTIEKLNVLGSTCYVCPSCQGNKG